MGPATTHARRHELCVCVYELRRACDLDCPAGVSACACVCVCAARRGFNAIFCCHSVVVVFSFLFFFVVVVVVVGWSGSFLFSFVVGGRFFCA